MSFAPTHEVTLRLSHHTIVAFDDTKTVLSMTGTTHVLIKSKIGTAAVTTSSEIFSRLAADGIPTHFVEPISRRSSVFRARRTAPLPLSIIGRREHGDIRLTRRRHVNPKGAPLVNRLFELFKLFGMTREVISAVAYQNRLLCVPDFAEFRTRVWHDMERIFRRAFGTVEAYWQGRDFALQELHLEFCLDEMTAEVVVGGLIADHHVRLTPLHRPDAKPSGLRLIGASLDETAAQ